MKKNLVVAAIMASGLLFCLQAPASADTKANYEKNCKKCHGMDGVGDTSEGKKLKLQDLTSAEYWKKATDKKIHDAIADGVTDPENPKRKMKGYKDKMSEAEIKDMVEFVKKFKK